MLMQFLRDRHAAVAPIFAIAAIPLIIATGAVIDFSRAYRQRTVVQDSLDAAALASGKQIGKISDTAVKLEATNFYNSNVGTKVNIKPTITPAISGSTITLTTQLHVPTYFLGMIGLNEFVFNLTSQATSAAGTLEVAMVLDNSTSMNLPSSKISSLRTAANELATTLWNLGTTSTKPEPVKIAIVPFGGAVNVGPSVTWIDTTGAGTTTAMRDATLLGAGNNDTSNFNPYSIFSSLKDSSNNNVTWAGCVEERAAPYNVTDDPPSTSASPSSEEKKTLFEPMVAPDEPDNWNCSTGSCNYLGTSSTNRRWNGAPTGTQTYNNYLPDAGTAATCGTSLINLTSVTSATPGAFNKTSHGLTAGTAGMFSSTSSLPTGLSSSTTYYVSPAGLSANTFYAATTMTGTAFTVGTANTTFTVTIANPAVITANAHGLTAGTAIIPSGGTLPTGLTSGTTYYVFPAGIATNTFMVSTTTTGTTVTASTNTFTKSAHGLTAGTALSFKSTGTLPSPLSATTTYYVLSSNLTTNTFRIATTPTGTAVSVSGGSGTLSYLAAVKTTGSQSGTHTYTKVGAPSVFTSNAHGLVNNDAVAVSSTGTLPAPLSASTIYYVVSSATNTFGLATTSGGTGVTVTGSSTGTLSFIKLTATTSTGSGTISFATNSLAYTCTNGDCSSGVSGKTEKAAFGGQSVTGAPMCKYGTSGNKAVMADITVANLTGAGKGGPNFMCTTTAITPLTTNQTTVSNAITAMQPNGYTNITSGLMWGWRTLSSGVPFTEGRAEGTSDNQKIIVLMTDGENTYLPYLQIDQNPSTSSTYAGKFVKSGYGAWNYLAENHLGTTSILSADVYAQLNARTTAACAAAKAADILIYTVGFEINDQTSSDPATALALLRGCATTTDRYYDAQNESQLLAAFNAIGDDISQLRLSQ